MVQLREYRWLVAAGVAVVGLLLFGGFWPHAPLYAVATDRVESFAMATGPVDAENGTEAVYFLDFLTGDLTAVVLGKQGNQWTGWFHTNVTGDLSGESQRNPKYMMVTGLVNLRRGGGSRQQPGSAMCYVAEITSGKVVAYAIPWSPSMYASGQPQNGPLVRVGLTSFRQSLGDAPAPVPAPPAGGGRRPKQAQ